MTFQEAYKAQMAATGTYKGYTSVGLPVWNPTTTTFETASPHNLYDVYDWNGVASGPGWTANGPIQGILEDGTPIPAHGTMITYTGGL